MAPCEGSRCSIGIRTLGDTLGDSDVNAVLAVSSLVQTRQSDYGFPLGTIDGLSVFKANKAEAFGTKAVYLAFGTRPARCVADEYFTCSARSSRSASSGGGGDGCSPSSSFIDKFACLPDEFPGNQVDMAFEQAAEEWALGGRRRTRQALLVGNKVDAPKRKKSRGSVHDVDATIRLLEEANAPWRQEVDERERERGMLEQEVQRVTEAADVKASSDAREIRRLSNSNVLVGAQVEREKKKRQRQSR